LFTFDILVCCTNFQGLDLSQDELIALTRDHFGRTDPDELLNGFFPVWAGIQFLIACKLFKINKMIYIHFCLLTILGFFFIIAVISTICYFLGCRTPAEAPKKRTT
jgi:hypothetical protein